MVMRPCGSFVVDLYYLDGCYCALWRQLPTAGAAYVRPFVAQASLYPYLSLISLRHNLLA